METYQIRILNPKAKNLLEELADLKLIQIEHEKSLFPLNTQQKKSIKISRAQVKNGEYKSHKTVMSDLKKWLKNK